LDYISAHIGAPYRVLGVEGSIAGFLVAASFIMTAFEQLLANFRAGLPDDEKAAFEVTTDVGEVWNEMKRIQKEQEKKKTLRYMRRIKPFLDSLHRYSEVLEVFVQAKPDVLAFIWVSAMPQISHIRACNNDPATSTGSHQAASSSTFYISMRNILYTEELFGADLFRLEIRMLKPSTPF
jgi:hypothetical protein